MLLQIPTGKKYNYHFHNKSFEMDLEICFRTQNKQKRNITLSDFKFCSAMRDYFLKCYILNNAYLAIRTARLKLRGL